MTLKTRPFDPVEFLTTPERIDAFLPAAREDRNPLVVAVAEAVAERARAKLAAQKVSSGRG